MATRKRTLAKSLTWRVVATSITFIVSYIITGHIDVAGGIAGIDATAKMVAYYYHDRMWLKINWGRIVDPK